MDTQETPFRWEATETQFMPRVLICLRFSDLEGEVKGWLDRDLRDVALGIKMATEDLGTQWDSVVSSKEFTVPEFAPEASPEQRRRQQWRVLDQNRSAENHSDCLIAHAWCNGSSMLGDIQRAFLEGGFSRPVIVLHHEDNKRFSHAWQALAQEHPQLEILEFSDDLPEQLRERLHARSREIEASAQAREQLERQWRPICDALVRALGRETRADRATFARELGRSELSLLRLVRSPMQMAALSSARADLIRIRYGEAMRVAMLQVVVERHFSAPELKAYRVWSLHQPQHRVIKVIEREAAQREIAGVFKPRMQRRTPESWELLASEFDV